jgi:hypothetical protein
MDCFRMQAWKMQKKTDISKIQKNQNSMKS